MLYGLLYPIDAQFSTKNSISKKTMNVTIHKWVLNVMTGPNPTQYTAFDKYVVKTKNEMVQNTTQM